MAEIMSNFMGYFFPNVSNLPEPVQVLIGSLFLTLFFGLILRICKR